MSSPEEPRAVNSRRIRSRIAQQEYRKRHKEKFHSSQKRAQDLEAAAQRACKVFTDLTSVLIRSRVLQDDPALTVEVLNAVKEFHNVAKVVDQDDRNSGPLDVGQPSHRGGDSPNVAASVRSDNQIHPTMTESAQLDPKPNKSMSSTSNNAASNQNQLGEVIYSQPPSDQILVSPSYFALEFAISGDPSSIGSRLLRMTLSSGYEALKGSSGHITDLGIRIFGLTLSYRNRDDVLSEFQWWLGPGQSLASRLKQARQYPGVPTSETYLSVEDVAMLLQDVGVVNTQDDVLEFSNSSSTLGHSELNPGFNALTKYGYDASNANTYMFQSYSPAYSESAWRNNPALQAFNFNSLMGNLIAEEENGERSHNNAHHTAEENTRRTVPISVFLQSLANISVCLSIGPGYPQQAVKALIYASISGMPMQ